MKLLVNALVEWIDTGQGSGIERLLHIDPLRDVVQVIRVDRIAGLNRVRSLTDLNGAMHAGRLRVLDNDPYACQLHVDPTAKARHLRRAEAAMRLIQPIIDAPDGGVFLPEVRGPLVAMAVKEHNVSRKRIYQYLGRWMRGGMTEYAVYARYFECGARGKERKAGLAKRGRPRELSSGPTKSPGVNVDADMRDKLQTGYRMFVLKERGKGGHPTKKGFEMTLMRFFATSAALKHGVVTPVLPVADRLPTLRQFIYWGTKGLDERERLLRLHGERRFALRYRPVLGDSTLTAIGPGSVYQFDSTIPDLWIVSALLRSRRLGRPVLYLVIDVFSRMVVGFYIGLENASLLAAGLALENAFGYKQEYCASVGIEIAPDEWPCKGLPESIFADRGELEGPAADHLVKALSCRLSNAPPYRADAKGIVERGFRTLNDLAIHWQPGAVFKPWERGEHDPRLDACLTLHEFRQLVVYAVLFHNRSLLSGYRLQPDMIADQVVARPIDLWAWGVVNRTGHLRTMDPSVVRLHCLPGGKATVTARGIRFNGLFYSCPLALRERWFETARASKTWCVDVAFDPRCVDQIYLRSPDTRVVETCRLVDAEQRFLSRTWDEVNDFIISQKGQQQEMRSEQLQGAVDLQAQAQAIVDKARKEAAVANQGLTKAAKLRGIRENRVAEQTFLAESLDPNSTNRSNEKGNALSPLSTAQKVATENDYVAPPCPLDLLEQQRDAKITKV
jgi:hypothetical protein